MGRRCTESKPFSKLGRCPLRSSPLHPSNTLIAFVSVSLAPRWFVATSRVLLLCARAGVTALTTTIGVEVSAAIRELTLGQLLGLGLDADGEENGDESQCGCEEYLHDESFVELKNDHWRRTMRRTEGAAYGCRRAFLSRCGFISQAYRRLRLQRKPQTELSIRVQLLQDR